MAKSKIEWTEQTWNPVTGCDRTSPGCDHCLHPDTPVLMADMTWKPIGKITVGEQVVAFTEEPALGQNRVFELATVLKVWTVEKDAVEITVGDRTVVASADHKFLAVNRPYWREAGSLSLSSEIVNIGIAARAPMTESESYLDGYVAGAFGGDGTFRLAGSGKNGTLQSYGRVAVPTFDIAILDRIAQWFIVKGFDPPRIQPFDQGRPRAPFVPAGQPEPMSKIETRRRACLLRLRDAMIERDDYEWRCGFLAGFLDTDGCYSGSNLRYNQTKPNDLLDITERCIHAIGFSCAREDFRSASGRSVRVSGDIAEKIRFLSSIQPALARKCADHFGRRFPARSTSAVNGVRRVGRQTLVDITTTSGTFIAAGLATHNCYALTLAKRLKAMGSDRYQNDGNPRTSGPGFGLTLHLDMLNAPLRWTKPRRVFVNSMSDLLHEDVPVEFIAQTFAVMSLAPAHTFQVLTKRSKRMMMVLNSPTFLPAVLEWRARLWEQHTSSKHPKPPPAWSGWPLTNVWLGVSIETDRYTFRADHLRDTPAATRWISAEPLIGPLPSLSLHQIDWLVAGGESGTGARPVHPDWVRQLRDMCICTGGHDCKASNHIHGCFADRCRPDDDMHQPTAFFFKQWGAHQPTSIDTWDADRPAGLILLPSGAMCGSLATVAADEHATAVVVRNVGKAHSGRVLDDTEWMQYPNPTAFAVAHNQE